MLDLARTILSYMPRTSWGEIVDGDEPPYSAFAFFSSDRDAKDWAGDSDTSTIINNTAAGMQPVNLVTGTDNPKAIITKLLQNDVQRSALAQLAFEQREQQNKVAHEQLEHQAMLADLETYSRIRRGDRSLVGDEPAVAEGPEVPTVAAIYYEQGRRDLVNGGVSPMQSLEFPVQDVGLAPTREPEMGMGAKLGLSAGALASASQLGASINKFASSGLNPANDISMPAAVGVGARRSTREMALAA